MKTFNQWLIIESKQEIINLGYPEVIAKLFYKRFGNQNAFLLAKWYKDYNSLNPGKNWFDWSHSNFNRTSIPDLIKLYQATDSPENYINVLKKLDLQHDENIIDDFYLEDQRKELFSAIEQEFFEGVFFRSPTIISDIINGKLKNVAPYKDLKFWDAQNKYDEKNVFKNTKPLKVYDNGFRWIDVGSKCQLVGGQMKNCGSAGLMSSDKDRTIIALFDSENKSHVVVTYSPNERRISGDQGVASTAVKPEYHEYVLDLAKFLNVRFDVDKSKSKLLSLKYILQNKGNGIKELYRDNFTELYSFEMNGQIYYTDGYVYVSQKESQFAQKSYGDGKLVLMNKHKNWVKMLFNAHNRLSIRQIGVKFLPVSQLVNS